jgi:hypothetical protein
MKTFVVLLFLTLFPPLIGSSGDSSPAYSRSSERSSVVLRVKADYAVFPLTISSDQKESGYRMLSFTSTTGLPWNSENTARHDPYSSAAADRELP